MILRRSRAPAWRSLLRPGLGLAVFLVLALSWKALGMAGGEPGRVLAFALLVLVPLGLNLVRAGLGLGTPWLLVTVALWTHPVGAAAALVALALPRGVPATLLAGVWLLPVSIAALAGAWMFLWPPTGRQRWRGEELCVVASLVFLVPGAVFFGLHRSGAEQALFSDTIVFLTAVHFHVIPPGALLTAGLAGRFLARRRRRGAVLGLARAACWLTTVSPLVVASGFTFYGPLQLAGAVGLALGLWTLALVTLFWIVPAHPSWAARFLLAVACLTLVPTMVLAVAWAWEATLGRGGLSLDQLVWYHGWPNAVGFSLAALLAWSFRKNGVRHRSSL